jgi:hypothetical protein
MMAADPDGLLKRQIGELQEAVSFIPQAGASPEERSHAPCAAP